MHEWVPVVQNAGADIVVVLTSLGVPFDREDVYKEMKYNKKSEDTIAYNKLADILSQPVKVVIEKLPPYQVEYIK